MYSIRSAESNDSVSSSSGGSKYNKINMLRKQDIHARTHARMHPFTQERKYFDGIFSIHCATMKIHAKAHNRAFTPRFVCYDID